MCNIHLQIKSLIPRIIPYILFSKRYHYWDIYETFLKILFCLGRAFCIRINWVTGHLSHFKIKTTNFHQNVPIDIWFYMTIISNKILVSARSTRVWKLFSTKSFDFPKSLSNESWWLKEQKHNERFILFPMHDRTSVYFFNNNIFIFAKKWITKPWHKNCLLFVLNCSWLVMHISNLSLFTDASRTTVSSTEANDSSGGRIWYASFGPLFWIQSI